MSRGSNFLNETLSFLICSTVILEKPPGRNSLSSFILLVFLLQHHTFSWICITQIASTSQLQLNMHKTEVVFNPDRTTLAFSQTLHRRGLKAAPVPFTYSGCSYCIQEIVNKWSNQINQLVWRSRPWWFSKLVFCWTKAVLMTIVSNFSNQ